MILSAADLVSRVNHPRNSVKDKTPRRAPSNLTDRTVDDLDRNDKPAGPDLYIRNATPGKRPGDKDLPPELQIPASVLVKLGVESRDIQETFGIGPGTVRNLGNEKGMTEEAKAIVHSTLDVIKGKVVEKLDQSVNYLTEDKFANAKGVELTSMMRALAATVKDISPDSKEGGSKVQVVIHSVNQREADHYEVIEVNT